MNARHPHGEDPASGLVSPSLTNGSDAGAPAFEMKFLIPEATAQTIQAWGEARLKRDPFADPSLNFAYETSTLYLDTPAFDILRRTEGFNRRKYRVRRYGVAPQAFLERKTRQGDQVRKRRTEVELEQLKTLAQFGGRRVWSGDWFQRKIESRNFRPVCRMTYLRTAFMGKIGGSTARLTFDRTIRGETENSWQLDRVAESRREILPGEVICELKFREAMPAIFKSLVEEFSLQPIAVSKYRRFMATLTAEGKGPPNHASE